MSATSDNERVRLRLAALWVARAPADDPARARVPAGPWSERLLEHQARTVTALDEADVVVNTAPTGTGKTLAALLGLASRPGSPRALIIAPTNALVAQHEADARAFVRDAGLPHHVLPLDAERLGELKTDVRRRGERLRRILDDPGSEGAAPGAPLLLVTNPDTVYAAIFARYATLDRTNLQARFLGGFDYVVVDELHLYDPAQLASFLLFLVLSRELGFFDRRDRKVLLLTATPARPVEETFGRLEWLGIRVRRVEARAVAPGSLEGVPVLAPLDLELAPARRGFRDAVAPDLDAVVDRVRAGDDALIVSDRLADVNRLAVSLRARLGERVRRVTGPVPREQRDAATRAPLVIATPTVDVGFNFAGREKDRQGIDLVLAEASTLDCLWQRLGRCGRVLGKPVADRPAWGVAYVPGDALVALRELDGASLSRSEAAARIVGLVGDAMARAWNAAYLSFWAFLEAAWPLLLLERQMPAEHEAYVERSFTLLRDVLAPGTRWTWRGARGWARRQQGLERLAEELEHGRVEERALSPSIVRAWCEDRATEVRVLTDEDVSKARARMLRSTERHRADLVAWLEEQRVARNALLRFRGGGIDVAITVSDPLALITESRQPVALDLVHLLRNLEVEAVDASSGPRLRVQGLRETPLRVEIHADRPERTAEDFGALRLGRVLVLRGARAVVRVPATDAVVPQSELLVRALANRLLVVVFVPEESAALGKARSEGFRPLPIEVQGGGGDRAPWSLRLQGLFGKDAYLFLARFPGELRDGARDDDAESGSGSGDLSTQREVRPCP